MVTPTGPSFFATGPKKGRVLLSAFAALAAAHREIFGRIPLSPKKHVQAFQILLGRIEQRWRNQQVVLSGRQSDLSFVKLVYSYWTFTF